MTHILNLVSAWPLDEATPKADITIGTWAVSIPKPVAELIELIGDRVYVELPAGASPLQIGRALREAWAAA